jgi:hypothetical protein
MTRLPAAMVCVLLAVVPAVLFDGGTTATGAAGAVSGPGGDWGATASTPCDGLDTSLCMLPFPNDFYTVADPGTPTGRRVVIPAGAFPDSTTGRTFDPSPWEHNDGFSPGSTILVHVPGLSLSQSHVATIGDMGASLARSSPIVLVDARTGAWWPTWAELDARDPNPATQLLVIHPARNLTEGDRYIVALRDLRTSDGTAIPPGPGFSAVLGLAASGDGGPPDAAYVAHLRDVLRQLRHAGLNTQGLYLAWDFTVASASNITEPEITMRDQTFAALHRGLGSFRVSGVVNDPPGRPELAREVRGTFDVPSYLSGPPGGAQSVLTEGTDGLPTHEPGDVDRANFECEIPRSATAAHPAKPGVYGHGLFGSAAEVTESSVPQFSDAYDYVFCGTDWVGLSSSTLALAVSVTGNFNGFPALADNLMQSLLNAQVLGNLMVNPRGFASDPAFEGSDHRTLLRTGDHLVYYGNSEGGIMGGAFAALSTESRRVVLGVPGMDYAVLLPRSADFAPFQSLIDDAYPDKAVQLLGFDVLQMLWDRAETDGYAEQMVSGLPGTPHHQILLEEAFGDHQVTNISTETEARTIGAALRMPALSAGRSREAEPFWGLAPLRDASPTAALFVWDTGVPPEPSTDTPPLAGPDPHDTTPRSFPKFWAQMNTFFASGHVVDPCGTKPCTGPGRLRPERPSRSGQSSRSSRAATSR